MTISPLQPNNVTRVQFEEFESYVKDGFETVINNIGCVDQNVIKVHSQMTELRSEMRQTFKETREEIRQSFKDTKRDILDELAKTSAKLLGTR
jgi:hypothetical protein